MKFVPALFVSILLLGSSAAEALPRFASRTGAQCQSCHVDPSGAAMRQAFGVQYGREQLPVPGWSQDLGIEDFSNAIGNALGVGADLRTLYFSQQSRSGGFNDAFFQMQGDLYLNFKVAKKVSLFLNKGLYSGFEAFALLSILPSRGHIKVGKFIPDFGTKIDDHTTYIRTYTGFSPEFSRPELTGVEAGIAPGGLTLTGGVYNATDGVGSGTGNRKSYLGRVEYMLSPGGDVHLSLGGNVFGNAALKAPVAGPADAMQTLVGAFGALSVGQFTLFGETDWIQSRGSATPVPRAFVSYVEADYPVVTGVDLKVAYDFYDPDLDLKTGTASRYSVGVEVFPLPGVEVRPMYRIVNGTVASLKNEFDMMLHLYF